MEIRSLLNDFEYDWASFPAKRADFPTGKLKGKSVLVAGVHGNIARLIVFSLLAANDIRDLNLSVSLLADEECIEGVCRDLAGRDELRCFVFGRPPEELPRADIVIDAGVCSAQIDETPEFFMRCVSNIKYTLECAEKTGAQHFTLLSDYRAYRRSAELAFSEDEGGAVPFSSADGADSMLVQTLECYTSAYAADFGFGYTVLRCASILGADAGFDDGFAEDMLRAVAFGSGYTVKNSPGKISFVYISDVLNAVFRSFSDLPANTAYNVVGGSPAVSIGALAATLYDLYPDKAKIKLVGTRSERLFGAALSGEKISACGCKPEVSLEQAVQLVVKSQLHDDKPFALAACGGERLSTVRRLILLCLLEIDRVCRKNKIRYFLTGDLLLGAVRFKGFIPWGGDNSVMMLRSDYDRFIAAAKELPAGLTLISFDKNPLSDTAYARLAIDGTFDGETPMGGDGVYIDIIPQDRTTNRKTPRWLHVNFIRRSKRRYKQAVTAGAGRNPFKRLRLKIMRRGLRRLLRRYERKKDAKFLYEGLDRNYRIGYFPRKWLKNAVYWDFEGYRFPIPKEYDRYLKYLYGDYKSDVASSVRLPERSYENINLGKYEGIRLPVRPHHNISIIRPISEAENPLESYPGRGDTEGFVPRAKRRREGESTGEFARRINRLDDSHGADVKIYSPDGSQAADTGKNKSKAHSDDTIEFSLGGTTDISKFSDSREIEKLADTREFELPKK